MICKANKAIIFLIKIVLVFSFSTTIPCNILKAQKLQSDKGDGTYTNPVTTGTFSAKSEASTINSDSLKDPFEFDKQSQYLPVVKEVPVNNNKLTYSFPPHSFTQIKIPIKK